MQDALGATKGLTRLFGGVGRMKPYMLSNHLDPHVHLLTVIQHTNIVKIHFTVGIMSVEIMEDHA